jgi:hypothetical protein
MAVVARCVLYLFDSNLMLSVLAPFHHPMGGWSVLIFREILWFPAKLRVRIWRNTPGFERSGKPGVALYVV